MSENHPRDEDLLNPDDPFLDSQGVVEFCNGLGFKMSPSWLEKLDAKGEGPPVDCIWGKRKLRRRSTTRNWVIGRMRRVRVEPGSTAA
jgi:hypothetical protein